MVYAALLHDGVGGMSGLDPGVHGDMPLGDGAVPDIMVALAAADECAIVHAPFADIISAISDWRLRGR